jgi:tetratricopeptide (TPR) repeat protein
MASWDYWRRHLPALHWLAVPFAVIAACGLLGLRRLRGADGGVVGLFVWTYFASLLPFFPTARYRQPLVPLLCIAAAVFLLPLARDLWSWIRNCLNLSSETSERPSRRLRGLLWACGLSLLLWPRWAAFSSEEVLWRVHVNRAQRLSLLGELTAAREALLQADTHLPRFFVTHLKLGDICREHGAYTEALAAYQEAHELAPDQRIVHYDLGRTLYQLGRLDEAITAYRNCMEVDQTWARPHFGLAMVFREQGDLTAAVAAMTAAIAADPGAVHYRNNLASLYAEAGQLARAQEELTELVARFPSYVKGWINLALVRYNSGETTQAGAALDRAAACSRIQTDEAETIRRLRVMFRQGPQASP